MRSEYLRHVSVRDVLALIFPNGTEYHKVEEKGASLVRPPNWPPDMFAAGAFLLNISGAYHRITPGGEIISDKNGEYLISDRLRERLREQAQRWRAAPNAIPPEAIKAWSRLRRCKARLCLSRDIVDEKSLPAWWADALILAAVADETCLGLGQITGTINGLEPPDWIIDPILGDMEEQEKSQEGLGRSRNNIPVTEPLFSWCLAASTDVLAVAPKARTPALGCTIRSVSQNLALLPPSGVMQAGWATPPVKSLNSPDNGFRALLIPFPYQIDDDAFKTNGSRKRWSWFELEQPWLPDSESEKEMKRFTDFIDKLVEQAETASPVNAIFFPEYALNWDVFDHLVQHVSKTHSSVSMIVSGSSSNCEGATGNFVLTAQILHEATEKDGQTRRLARTTSRAKHHRWRIDKNQIEEYELTGAFPDDTKVYWEKMPILRRQIHAAPFRDGSVFVPLICEDLARSEPCHQYVRALGPNIVLVLLMDGPQIEKRWSARYALSLSEDPGSAVLTFTSKALIARSNSFGANQDPPREVSHSIAMFRNPNGKPHEIECDDTHHAVVVEFKSKQCTDLSIDGRPSLSWEWSVSEEKKGVIPIAIPRSCVF